MDSAPAVLGWTDSIQEQPKRKRYPCRDAPHHAHKPWVCAGTCSSYHHCWHLLHPLPTGSKERPGHMRLLKAPPLPPYLELQSLLLLHAVLSKTNEQRVLLGVPKHQGGWERRRKCKEGDFPPPSSDAAAAPILFQLTLSKWEQDWKAKRSGWGAAGQQVGKR